MDQANLLRERLAQVQADLDRARDKRTRLDAQIGALETDLEALARAIELISADHPASQRGHDGGALRAVLSVTEPGQKFRVADVVLRLEERGASLESKNAANAISTALARAPGLFVRLRRGEYQRVDAGVEKQEAPPPDEGSGALSLN
jgi:septal ring factor EnvC (AmiA/AmiB activator)